MNKDKFFKIKASAGNTAEVFIYDEIGGWGVWTEQLVKDLAGIDASEITVRINSPGGDAYDGVAIMNALRAHPAHVTTVVEGLCASAASVIAVGGGDRMVMRPHSELMIHDAWCYTYGNAADLEVAMAHLDRLSDSMAQIYADKTSGDAGMWREAMRLESWFSAEEAVEAGLADAVEDARSSEAALQTESLAKSASGFKALARYEYSGRKEAPRPIVLKKEARMGAKEEKIARLETMLKSAQELFAEVIKDEREPEEKPEKIAQAEERLEKARSDAESEESDADGDEPECSEEETTSEEETESDANDEDAEAPEDDGLTVTIDAQALKDLQEAAAYGMKARQRDEQNSRVEKVEKAIAENRISGSARDRWIQAMEADEEDATARLNAIPKDLIPRASNETGYARQNFDEDTENASTHPENGTYFSVASV